MHEVEVAPLQQLGHGPARAGADDAAVDLADGRDLGRGAREEGLVGDVDLVAADAPLAHLDALLARQPDDRVARDAVEGRGQLRRVQHAVAHDEDVLAAALGDVALGVEQQRLVVAAGERLVQRQHGVHVVAVGLGLAHRDVDVVAREGGGLDADAALHVLLAEIGAPLPGRHHAVHAQVVGAQAHALGAVEAHGPDVAGLEAVLADHGEHGLVDGVLVPGQRHAEDAGGAEQAVGVRLQAEDRGAALRAVGADALEDAEPIVEGVGEHVHAGLTPGHQRPVEPDDPVAVRHAHRCLTPPSSPASIQARHSAATAPRSSARAPASTTGSSPSSVRRCTFARQAR